MRTTLSREYVEGVADAVLTMLFLIATAFVILR